LAAGAGFHADIFGSSGVALRVEYRHRVDGGDDQGLSIHGDDDLASIGLQVPFGRRATPTPVAVPDPDDDGDGVPNRADRCPGTPAGSVVDAFGCVPVRDSDGEFAGGWGDWVIRRVRCSELARLIRPFVTTRIGQQIA